jgi:hypothetical protein
MTAGEALAAKLRCWQAVKNARKFCMLGSAGMAGTRGISLRYVWLYKSTELVA